ncbi:MAG TPA: Amuc_1100 family pilus-like protein [Methylomirabilota bacterium]|nr:Amuc_1100 family pilus-like protein [Methylomirabilota bacterium]
MLWIKRNLFLAVGGLVALLLLGSGGYYLLSNYSRSRALDAELGVTRDQFANYYTQAPFPHQTNVDAARREAGRVREAITNARNYFTPIPFTNVTQLEFKKLLDSTIAGLHALAAQNNVRVTNAQGKPHNFSFDAEKIALSFPSAAFPALPQQLAEVRTICSIIITSKVSELVGVRRWRVPGYSDQGAGTDYHDSKPGTNEIVGASIIPYEVKFICFSQELASVLENLTRSRHGFNVKPQSIEPVGSLAAGATTAPGLVPATPVPPRRSVPGSPRGGATQRDPFVTAIDEQRSVVTLLIEVIRLSP